jgi:hypothetical protein
MRLLAPVHTVLEARCGGEEVLSSPSRSCSRTATVASAPDATVHAPPSLPRRKRKPDADANGAKGDQQTFFGFGNGTKSKEPITITSDTLEYEYKDGIIVYRGDVLAVQARTKIKSNELRITLAKTPTTARRRSGSDAVGALDDASASKLQSSSRPAACASIRARGGPSAARRRSISRTARSCSPRTR